MNGYDTSFPVACAEDIELSYRMSARGWKMKFAPQAIVYHTHPATFSNYLKKKYKFAFWRMLAVQEESRQRCEGQPHAADHEAAAVVCSGADLCGDRRSGPAAKDSDLGNRCCGISAEHDSVRAAGVEEGSCGGDSFAGPAGGAILRSVFGSDGWFHPCCEGACAREEALGTSIVNFLSGISGGTG